MARQCKDTGMATATDPTDSTDEQADDTLDAVDATHVTGDIWFVNKYPRWVWVLGALLCVVPPAGALYLSFCIFSGIHTDGEPVEVAAE